MYGWSEFSPITYILAADTPSTPPKPSFVSATDNSISIQLYPAADNGGSIVESYELEMDQGDTSSAFAAVVSYDKTSFFMHHTVTYALDGIVTGRIYRFRFRASNSKGYSDYSELLSVAANSPPVKANTPLVDYSLSSRTSIFVSWVLNSDGLGEGGLISGYKLYMDNGLGGDFNVVMNTVGYSSQLREYLAVNLTESLQYRFKLEAYNYNELAPGP